jgi:hypothetical protein
VAFIALVVAMAGTGYAATKLPKNSVGSKQLKTNAVSSKKIKNGAVNSDDCLVHPDRPVADSTPSKEGLA